MAYVREYVEGRTYGADDCSIREIVAGKISITTFSGVVSSARYVALAALDRCAEFGIVKAAFLLSIAVVGVVLLRASMR